MPANPNQTPPRSFAEIFEESSARASRSSFRIRIPYAGALLQSDSAQSAFNHQCSIDRHARLGALSNGDSDEQDVARCVTRNINAGNAAFLGETAADDAAF